ncbi:hypothetical protein [Rhodococcus sp. ARC_M6]|uniref:hypothetical protein n=1 Tax=Rhodococcus sp. ARC_M6 TaxID=2928852 RepID=UPI001FB1F88A|nr:hypothetical protein [Rhodococcus sp. ARC_M6]MCJ0902593.1 hypothetical protein [Rhodococcus sp. ARC_M6]
MTSDDRARPGDAARSGRRRRGLPNAGSAAASARDGRGAEFFPPEMLPRDEVGDDFGAAGGLGGSGRLRGSRPEAPTEAAVDLFAVFDDRAAAPDESLTAARLSLSVVLP